MDSLNELGAPPKVERCHVVTRSGNTLHVLGSADSVVAARKLMRTFDPGVYSIISYNELDVPVEQREAVVRAKVGRGVTFGKARGPRVGSSKPRKVKAAKS